jgi:FtsZ-interacting cell division protein YlmF
MTGDSSALIEMVAPNKVVNAKINIEVFRANITLSPPRKYQDSCDCYNGIQTQQHTVVNISYRPYRLCRQFIHSVLPIVSAL